MWIYDGLPNAEAIRSSTPKPRLEAGGNIVIFLHETGNFQIISTIYPAKIVSNWNRSVARQEKPVIKRVIISMPAIMYHKIKHTALKAMSLKDEPTPSRLLKIAQITLEAHLTQSQNKANRNHPKSELRK